MTKTYIGIDPGLKGGVAIISPDGNINLFPTPLIAKEEIDVLSLSKMLFQYRDCHVVIEKVHSIFGVSAAANFSFGFGCGALYAMLKILEVPFTEVSPVTWQKEMWQGVSPVMIPTDKKTKDGEVKYKVNTKATSLLAVKRLFPTVNLLASNRCTTPHDGMVDALLLASFGKRKNY